jgi:hypothetical protein
VSASLAREVETLRRRAADLAGRLSTQARSSTTIAQQRATLRMLGVDGLDRSGHPLAASAVERYCGSDPAHLAGGILLPFAVASLEYDLSPQELALDVASGAIDLGLEAEALQRPERLAQAEDRASKLLSSAVARFDANRTATREQRDVLGSPPEPWLGSSLRAADARDAAREIRQLVARDVDVVLVSVPASWEYAEARRLAARESEAGPGEGRRGRVRQMRSRLAGLPPVPRLDREGVPAGSQRGLAELRRAADQAAAERGCYVSLMTVASAFACPEQAVVAAFERIDLVEADPIREIVEDNVDPGRALADHAFAHRLQARAGCQVVMGAGALALGSDLASGLPSDATTRAGRALALQALGAELALAGGLPAERLLLGAVPAWIVADAEPGTLLVQAWLRRAFYPKSRLVIETQLPEAGAAGRGARRWTAPLVAAMAGAAAAMVVWDRNGGVAEEAAADLEAAAAAAAALRRALGNGSLHGDAETQARLTLRAAKDALERLAGDGWSSVLGPAGSAAEQARFGRAAVVRRSTGPGSEVRLLDRHL